MKVSAGLANLNYQVLQGNPDAEVSEVVYDSRKAEAGAVFVCMVGTRRDSHEFIPQVLEKGVRVLVIERELREAEMKAVSGCSPEVTVIRVKNARSALAHLSAARFGYPAKKMICIGVTGTKGKTTTTYMIKAILEAAGKKVGLIGTAGAVIGGHTYPTANTTPESYELQRYFAQMAEEGCEYMVMEVSSQGLKMHRVDAIEFDYGLFTNISNDHIGPGEHADFAEYLYYKSKMLNICRVGLINRDDEHYADVARQVEESRVMFNGALDRKGAGETGWEEGLREAAEGWKVSEEKAEGAGEEGWKAPEEKAEGAGDGGWEVPGENAEGEGTGAGEIQREQNEEEETGVRKAPGENAEGEESGTGAVRPDEYRCYTYALDHVADFQAGDIQYVSEPDFVGLDFKVSGRYSLDVRVNIPGRFNVYNALAAVAVCSFFDLPKEKINHALEHIHVNGRMEIVHTSERCTVIVDYAHNAVSMESLLRTLRDYRPKRLVCVFGCGGNRSKDRRYAMGEIGGRLADFCILTADNSRFEKVEDILADIRGSIEKTGGSFIEIPDRREAIAYSITHARPGDMIAVIGKGHEDYQEIMGVRYPFLDRQVIEEVIEQLEGGKK